MEMEQEFHWFALIINKNRQLFAILHARQAMLALAQYVGVFVLLISNNVEHFASPLLLSGHLVLLKLCWLQVLLLEFLVAFSQLALHLRAWW
jgi:hypothetical protein